MPNDQDPKNLQDILDQLEGGTDGDEVTVDELLHAFSTRSFGPLLLVPSLIALGPTGAIPGMSIVMGSVILLVAGQMLISNDRPWLPSGIRNFSFARAKLVGAIETARPYVRRVERFIKPRLRTLSEGAASYLVPIACILLALTMIPLAALPFAVAIPATALTCLSVGLMLKDGLLILTGYAVAAAAFLAIFSLL